MDDSGAGRMRMTVTLPPEAGNLLEEAIPMQAEEWRNKEMAVKVHSDGSKKGSTVTYAWVAKVAGRLVTGAQSRHGDFGCRQGWTGRRRRRHLGGKGSPRCEQGT